MVMLIFLIAVVVVLIIYGITIFNYLVQLKHNVNKSWSNIDVLLKQRHDELPKLVDSCKQHMQFEKSTLQQIVEARSKVSDAREAGDIAALGAAETQLRVGLGQLFAVVEAYPELKANETFHHLILRVTNLEDAIADRREEYNESVNNLNVRIEQFPDSIIAKRKNFKAATLLRFEKEQLKDVNITALFRD